MNGLDAALAVAREHGLRVDEPRVLKNRHNLVVHLAPAPVVARVGQSMSELRPGIRAREFELTQWLVERGLPILPLSDLLPPVVHRRDGHEMTFWPYVGEQRPPDGRAAGRALRAIEEALVGCPIDMGGFWPFYEVMRLNEELDVPPFVEQVRAEIEDSIEYEPVLMHGDTHFRNCFFTDDGPLWSDLEDACAGPPEWDAACLEFPQRIDGRDPEYEAALAELAIPDRDRFELLVRLRGVVNVTWGTFIYGRVERVEEQIAWLRRNVP